MCASSSTLCVFAACLCACAPGKNSLRASPTEFLHAAPRAEEQRPHGGAGRVRAAERINPCREYMPYRESDCFIVNPCRETPGIWWWWRRRTANGGGGERQCRGWSGEARRQWRRRRRTRAKPPAPAGSPDRPPAGGRLLSCEWWPV